MFFQLNISSPTPKLTNNEEKPAVTQIGVVNLVGGYNEPSNTNGLTKEVIVIVKTNELMYPPRNFFPSTSETLI